jgi:hypothetical protein
MIKKNKPAILILLPFIILNGLYGQYQNVPDSLSKKFLKYCEAVPREEVFIHSDREEYIAGEDLWFNAYVIDRQKCMPSLASRILYFEVLNSDNRPVAQKRINISSGFGPGQIVLPDTLSTGIYTIRAYTNWMKNFLPSNCFIKDVTIYNAINNKTLFVKSDPLSGKKSWQGINNDISSNSNGLILNINNLRPDTLELLVNSNEDYRSSNENILYLFIQTHGIINRISTEKLLAGTTRIAVPKKLLTHGINQITLFDQKGQPILERFIYTSQKSAQLLTLRSPDSSFNRYKISLEVEISNEYSRSPDSANLSISVSPETNNQIMDINDYIIFGSEFGTWPPGEFKNKKLSDLPPEEIDSLLLTVKSNWINWGKILSDNHPVYRYKLENEDSYIYGKLLPVDRQTVGSGDFLVMSSPSKEAVFQYSGTDSDGNFSFSIPIGEGLNDLIIQPDKVNKNQTINLESSFSDQYSQSGLKVNWSSKPVPEYISKWSLNYQVSKIFGSSFTGSVLSPHLKQIVQTRFYGSPDVELVLDDYIKLPVMQEVFFELLPGVLLRNKKSTYSISMINPISNYEPDLLPTLLIDGVIIKDATIIANLDPETVEKIDIIKNKYYVGNYVFDGIVNVITKRGDFSSVTLPGYAIRKTYRPFDAVGEFASPEYSSDEKKSGHNPDFRNTLYWNPSVIPDKSGKARIEFWTSDNSGNYRVNIQGITSDGKPISFRKILRVKTP